MSVSDIFNILQGKPFHKQNEKKHKNSELMPKEAVGQQEDDMSNKDEHNRKNRPLEGSGESNRRKPYDDEAEEHKRNQLHTDRDSDREPDIKSRDGSADGVRIEPMSWNGRNGFSNPYSSGGYYGERERELREYEQELRKATAEMQKDLGKRESNLRNWEERLRAREQQLEERESILQEKQAELRMREVQINERLQFTRLEADRILEQARTDAQSERQAILENAAEQEVKLLVQAHLGDYFDENAEREEDFRRSLNEGYAKAAMEHADLVEHVDQNAQALQLTLGQTVNEALSQIENARDQMMLELDKWRRMLYAAQYRDFATCFANLDKLVEGMEKRLAKELAEGPVGYHPELAEELKRYIKNMKTLRGTFERSLSNLGIRAFYPEAGTLFNSYFHTLADLDPEQETDEEFNDMPIVSCVKPGLLKVNEAGNDPLLLAVVTVDRNQP